MTDPSIPDTNDEDHLVHRRVSGEPVEVLLALDVPHQDTFPLSQDHRQGVVVVGVVPNNSLRPRPS